MTIRTSGVKMNLYHIHILFLALSWILPGPLNFPANILGLLRLSKKKLRFSSGFLQKRERAGGFFCYLLFPIACFLYTLLPSPRNTLELLGQILIKRNIRH